MQRLRTWIVRVMSCWTSTSGVRDPLLRPALDRRSIVQVFERDCHSQVGPVENAVVASDAAQWAQWAPVIMAPSVSGVARTAAPCR